MPLYLLIYPHHKTLTQKRYPIAEKLDPSELVDFEELLISNTIQLDTMYQLLIDIGEFERK